MREVGVTEAEDFRAMENLEDVQRIPSINPVNLNYFGSEICEPGHSYGPFIRTSYVLHFVTEGKGRLLKSDRTYEITAGHAFLIYPGEETFYEADHIAPWNYMWVGFHGMRAEEMISRAGFTREEPVIECENMEEFKAAMEGLLSNMELTYTCDILRTGHLYLLIGLLTKNCKKSADNSKTKEDINDRYVKMAVDLLINSGMSKVRVDSIARTIGISRAHLSSIFKKKMGISPQGYLIRFRMENAGDLLRFTDNPIMMIAAEVGYTDPLFFSKIFRKYYGMSPTEFREQKEVTVHLNQKGRYISSHPL